MSRTISETPMVVPSPVRTAAAVIETSIVAPLLVVQTVSSSAPSLTLAPYGPGAAPRLSSRADLVNPTTGVAIRRPTKAASPTPMTSAAKAPMATAYTARRTGALIVESGTPTTTDQSDSSERVKAL